MCVRLRPCFSPYISGIDKGYNSQLVKASSFPDPKSDFPNPSGRPHEKISNILAENAPMN